MKVIVHTKDHLFEAVDLLLEITDRFAVVVDKINREQYTESISGVSSIGQHVRHYIDFVQCLLKGADKGKINYDIRERSTEISDNPLIAKHNLKMLTIKIKKLYAFSQNKRVQVQESLSAEGYLSEAQSTVERELMFAADHGIHHLALIHMIGTLVGYNIPKHFAYNHATRVYQKSLDQLNAEDDKASI